MMSWLSFSQTDTPKIQLDRSIAELVAVDLIKGDGYKQELGLVRNQLKTLTTKTNIQGVIINNLETQIYNYQLSSLTYDKMNIINDQTINRLESDLKKSRLKNKYFTIGGGVIIGGILSILVLN